jgi:hypothetical protein
MEAELSELRERVDAEQDECSLDSSSSREAPQLEPTKRMLFTLEEVQLSAYTRR